MILTIISHTPHYNYSGKIYGWGPTIREINYLSLIFSKIYHVAPLYKETFHNATSPYNSKKIKFVPIKPSGGQGLLNKIDIVLKSTYNLAIIHNICKKADWIQFRAPTNLGLYVLPYLSFVCTKYRWIKYAGDWNQYRAPLSYAFQKHWLQNNFQKSLVTINGQFPNQRNHLKSFENPCLTNNELTKAKNIFKSKTYYQKLNLCFVGRMDIQKGAEKILKALLFMDNTSWINSIYFVGEGPEKINYEIQAKQFQKIKIVFTGFISRSKLNKIYEKCHIQILPSFASEGFPKVIAEGAAYGVVPIVSNVGGIKDYINQENGILINDISAKKISYALGWLQKYRSRLQDMAENCHLFSKLFTFESYNMKIKQIIKTNE